MLRAAHLEAVLATIIAATSAGGALAQDASQTPQETARQENATTLVEVVVTAQKRTESLQSVPISIAAITSDSLQKHGVTNSDRLYTAVPGLLITRQAKGGQVYMRGVGLQSTVTGNEGSVAMYVDGVYYPEPNAAVLSFNNIERIEVLRGPQGTLFGRNATGGLIHIITRDPQPDFSAVAGLSYGNFDTFEGNLYVTGGTDSIAADLAVYAIDQGEGFGSYINLPGSPEANLRKDTAARGKVVWRATENDKLTLSVDYSDSPSDIGLSRTAVPGSVLTGGAGFQGTIWDSMGGTVAQELVSKSRGASLRYEREMGSATLTFIDALRDYTIMQFYDQDSQPLRIVDVFQRNKTKSHQTELYVSGSAGRFDWTTGVFALTSEATGFPLSLTGVTPAINTDLYATQEMHSYAGYAQATYSVTDSTRLTTGLRYTQDEHEFSGRRVATPGNTLPVGTVLQTAFADSKASDPTWRLAVDQQLTDDVLAYVTYNRGFKSGTFNLSNITAPAVGPEKLDAYEVGIKSELFDHVLRLNVSGFYYDYKGIQITTVQAGIASFFNAAESEIKGAEVEATFAPRLATGRLQLTSGLSVLDTEYTCFNVTCGGSPGQITTPLPTGGNLQTSGDLSGNTLIRAPEWTLGVRADYAVPVGDGEMGLSVSYYHNDGFYWEPDNRLVEPAYDLVNAEISYSFGRTSKYRIRAFGTNLLDEEYHAAQQANAFGDTGVAAASRLYAIGFDVTL